MHLDVGEFLFTGEDLNVVLGISAPNLKAELERQSPHGESRFGLFRSARQSTSPVEEFMHLYNLLLLMLCNDLQPNVDAFILSEDAGVPQAQHPRGSETNWLTRGKG